MREFQNYKILIIDDDETAILQLEKAKKNIHYLQLQE